MQQEGTICKSFDYWLGMGIESRNSSFIPILLRLSTPCDVLRKLWFFDLSTFLALIYEEHNESVFCPAIVSQNWELASDVVLYFFLQNMSYCCLVPLFQYSISTAPLHFCPFLCNTLRDSAQWIIYVWRKTVVGHSATKANRNDPIFKWQWGTSDEGTNDYRGAARATTKCNYPPLIQFKNNTNQLLNKNLKQSPRADNGNFVNKRLAKEIQINWNGAESVSLQKQCRELVNAN